MSRKWSLLCDCMIINTVFVRIEGQYICGRWFSMNTNKLILSNTTGSRRWHITKLSYYYIANTNQHELHLKIRVVKGDPNSDLVVQFVDDNVGDRF